MLSYRTIKGLAALGAALVVSITLQGAAQAADAGAARDGARVIVKFRPNSPSLANPVASPTAERARRAKVLGDRMGMTFRAGRAVDARTQVLVASGTTSAELAQRLKRESDIEYAVPDERRHRMTTPNDPLYVSGPSSTGPASGQWYLHAPSGEVQSGIDVETAWNWSTGIPGVVVAVLDTGARYDHPDLLAASSGGNLLPGYDMIIDTEVSNDGGARDTDASDPGDWITASEANDRNSTLYQCTQYNPATRRYLAEDSSWHGTQVAGIIAAISNNGIGMAGVGPNLKVLPVRVLGKCGGYDSDIIAGMRWAAGLSVPGLPANVNRARVINMSLGGDGACSAAYSDAVLEIMNAGTVIVASAGNSEGHAVGSPANCSGVIGVAALRHVGTKVGFSDLGLDIAIAAPGGNCVNLDAGSQCLYPILTTTNTGTTGPAASTYTDGFNASVGTSFSAPLVAGTVALMLSAQPSLTPVQARLLMQKTARRFPTTGGDNGDGSVVPQCTVPRYDAKGNPIDQDQCYCTVNACGAGMLDAGAAVRAAATGNPGPSVLGSGLWWDLADGESGWGLNIAHQGDIIFVTWFTYDRNGKAWWLSMTAHKAASGPDVYTGELSASRGPAFYAEPFDPKTVTRATVGVGTITFSDLNTATFTYTLNGATHSKPIARQLFGQLPACAYGSQPNFAQATNYQDLWSVANDAESGWGINFTHQDDTIFATWFTYADDGSPMWVSVTATRTSAGVYSGQLYRTSGPPYDAVTFDSTKVTYASVGNATFTFSDGNNATFAYTLDGRTQSKRITRELFVAPAGTLCQ